MTGAPLVSLVIPAYNAQRTIGATIETALQQRYPSLEIIVIDDGSTDNTALEVARFGERIRIIRQENRGLAAARDAGHGVAQGSLIAWLDADDLVHPDRIALQVEVLLANPSIILVSSEFTGFTDNCEEFPKLADMYYSRLAARGGVRCIYGHPLVVKLRREWCHSLKEEATGFTGDISGEIQWGNIVHPPTVMFRRAVLDTVGGLDPRAGPAADWDFFIRASRVGPFAWLDAPLLRYRIHPGQMSGRANLEKHLLGELYVYRKTHGDPPPPRAGLLQEWRAAHAKIYADLVHVELDRSRMAAASYFLLAMTQRPPLRVAVVLLLLLAMPVAFRTLIRHIRQRLRTRAPVHLALAASATEGLPLPLLQDALGALLCLA